MPRTPLELEGPFVCYIGDGLLYLTICPCASDAADRASDLMALAIADNVFIGYMPRQIIPVARAMHPPQPESP